MKRNLENTSSFFISQMIQEVKEKVENGKERRPTRYTNRIMQSIFELLPLHSIPNQLETRHIVHIWEDLSPLSWFSLRDIPNYFAPRKYSVLNWVKSDFADTRGHCSQRAEHSGFLFNKRNIMMAFIYSYTWYCRHRGRCKYAQQHCEHSLI